MKFSEMPYVRPDMDKVKAELNACAEKIRTADSVEAQIAAFYFKLTELIAFP